MNAAEILTAVRASGASLRVEGGSLVASNASRLPPEIKTAIRENKPQIITALSVGRYRKVVAEALMSQAAGAVPEDRWQRCVEDGRRFLAQWGSQAEALGWNSLTYSACTHRRRTRTRATAACRRYDATGLIWLLQGRPVIALTEATAAIQSLTGAITVYRRHNKPALGPVGDSLDDLA